MQNTGYAPEDLIPLVAELANKFTGHEHSSISYEKAQTLMEAVLYCIHELELPENNALFHRQLSARDAYLAGKTIVIEKVQKLRDLYGEFLPDFQDYGSICLKETVIDGIPAFLNHYDIRFAPQETLLTLDYPILKDISALSGIDAVLEYVKCIQLEQQFLQRFSISYITETLYAYHEDYCVLIENICYIILQNLILRTLQGQLFPLSEFAKPNHTDRENIMESCVSSALRELISHYFDNDLALTEYFSHCVPDVAARLPYLVKGTL